MGAAASPPGVTAEELPDGVHQAFHGFDQMAPLLEGALNVARSWGDFAAISRRRLEALERTFAGATGTLPAEQAHLVRAVFGLLTGAPAWQRLRDDWGLDGDQAGEAVSWALSVLLVWLGRGPSSLHVPEFQAQQPRERRGEA